MPNIRRHLISLSLVATLGWTGISAPTTLATCHPDPQIAVEGLNVQIGRAVNRKKAQKKQKPDQKAITGISIAQTSGSLEKIGKAIPELAEISIESGELKLDLPQNYQQASNIKNQISRTLSDYGGSSSSSGSTFRCQLDSRLISGSIGKDSVSAKMELRENTNQQRAIFMEENGQEFSIRIFSPSGYHFLFKKMAGGKVFVQEVDGKFLFSGTFASFSNFSIQNPQYVFSRFIPVLKRFGIKPPSSPLNPSVVEVVGNLLDSSNVEQNKILEKYRDRLNSPKFSTRQAAMKEIKKAGKKQLTALCCLACDQKLPAELRFSFLELVSEFKPKFRTILEQVVMKQNLTKNASYLISILLILESDQKLSISQENKAIYSKRIRSQLAKISAIPANSKLDVYRKKIATSEKTVQPKISPKIAQAFFTPTGSFATYKTNLGKLVQLRNEDKWIRFHRKAWVDHLGGKSPKTHITELREEAKKRGLPKSTISQNNSNWYSLTEDSHALIHFHTMKDEIETSGKPLGYPYSSYRNSSRVRHRLVAFSKETQAWISMGTATLKLKTSPFHFEFQERDDQRRTLRVDHKPATKEIHISLYSADSNLFVRFSQNKNSGAVHFQRILGSETLNVTADSFEGLMKTHKKQWDESLGKFLSELKIISK